MSAEQNVNRCRNLYDVFDKDEERYICKANNCYELKELIGIEISQIRNYVGKPNSFKRRYIIVKTGEKIIYTPKKVGKANYNVNAEDKEEWDRLTGMFRKYFKKIAAENSKKYVGEMSVAE